MKWTVIMPVLNEVQLIETAIKHYLEMGFRLVIIEGSVPYSFDITSEGLSTDGTSEIIQKYADKLDYLKAGKCKDKIELMNKGLMFCHRKYPDTDILHLTSVDEFCKNEDYKTITNHFIDNQDWMIYTDYVNLTDGVHCRPNMIPISLIYPFSPGIIISVGMYHERFYRYRPDYMFERSPHAISDSLRRQPCIHPDYMFNRSIVHIKILHYKYVDDKIKLLKDEMNYIARDNEGIEFDTEEAFNEAKKRLNLILTGDKAIIPIEEHCESVRNSDWFKYETEDVNFDITYEDMIIDG